MKRVVLFWVVVGLVVPGMARSVQAQANGGARIEALARTAAAFPRQDGFALAGYTVEVNAEGTWLPFAAETYTHADGRLRSKVLQMVDFFTGTLVDAARSTYTYAEGGLASVLEEVWDGTAWVPGELTLYTYTDGALTGEMRRMHTGLSWENRYRTTMDLGAAVTIVEEEWDGATWRPASRTVAEQVGSDVVLHEAVWSGTDWLTQMRTTVHETELNALLALQVGLMQQVDEAGFLIMVDRFDLRMPAYTTEVYDEPTATWYKNERVTKAYGDGNVILFFREVGDDQGLVWVNATKSELNYTEARLSYIGEYEWEEGAWRVASGTSYTYDAEGNVDTATLSDAEGNNLQHAMRVRLDWEAGAPTVAETPTDAAFDLRTQPNPATDVTTVVFHLDTPADAHVRVFDVLGREVAAVQQTGLGVGAHRLRLDTSTWAAGLYAVRLDASGLSQTRVLTISR